jgi:hypothetical protein
MRSKRPTRLEAGIFLISFAILLVELLLTRIFSVTMFYHLSFLAVSLAMVGLGASGMLVNLWPRVFRRERMWKQTAIGALVFAAASTLAVGIAFQVPVSLDTTADNWRNILVVFGLCAIPFLSGGITVALILTHNSEQANRLYFFDLLGAALACVAFIPVTNIFGAPTAILAACGVAAAAAITLAGNEAGRWRTYASICLAFFVAAVAANMMLGFFDVTYTKGRLQRPTLAVRWNSFSRVEVNGVPDDLVVTRRPGGAGYSSSLPADVATREVWLAYDADANTQITGFDGDLAKVQYLGYDVSSAAYHMREHENVLVIGAGGGRDVLTARALGSGPVTGVEINPITVELMRTQFRDFTAGLYDNFPGIQIVNDEGRSYVRHSTERYGVIQASLVDTWAASATGAYSLSENSLYTVDAFDDYLDHLSPDGVVSFTRWYGDPPVEVLRVVSLAKESLARHGVGDASSHLFVVHTNSEDTGEPPLATILVKLAPFTTEELVGLRTWADRMRFEVSYAPDDIALGVPANDFHALLGPGAPAYMASRPFDLSAVTDDRPFFFDRVPLVSWMAHRLGLPTSHAGEGDLTLGGQTLLLALVATLASTLLLLMIPLASYALRGSSGARRQSSDRSGVSTGRALLWAVYFASLGLGFIMIEIVLIQRFSLYLGYPVYSLSVVLFTMLAASSVGSLASERWVPRTALPRALAAICVTLALYAFALPALLSATLGAPTVVRILIAALAVAPVGLLMGTPFPTGIRRAGREDASLVSWAWAVNGAASVFGSALTVLVSMTYGFSTSFVVGAAAYAVALAVMTWVVRRPETPGTEPAREFEPEAMGVS